MRSVGNGEWNYTIDGAILHFAAKCKCYWHWQGSGALPRGRNKKEVYPEWKLQKNMNIVDAYSTGLSVLCENPAFSFIKMYRRPPSASEEACVNDWIRMWQSGIKYYLSLGRVLGRGALSCVFRGRVGFWRTIVAIKGLEKEDKESPKAFCRELMIASSLHNPYIVPLVGFCIDPDDGLCLVYKFVSGGNLEQHLHGIFFDMMHFENLVLGDWDEAENLVLGNWVSSESTTIDLRSRFILKLGSRSFSRHWIIDVVCVDIW
ncbi:hypothetical protein LguiA_030319 [Lonicera macranthoides]